MSIFILFQGFFIEKIAGVFSSLELAKEAVTDKTARIEEWNVDSKEKVVFHTV